MLVHWLTAAPKSTTINLVYRETTRSDCHYHYLVIVVWIITIWEVGRVDITF